VQVPVASTSMADVPFEQTEPALKKSDQDAIDALPKHAPDTVAGRRNLRNFESRPPATDFETWRQAEAALQGGVSTKQLVQREFERDFGPECVQCAPPRLACAVLRFSALPVAEDCRCCLPSYV
jgi:hypothetical protein